MTPRITFLKIASQSSFALASALAALGFFGSGVRAQEADWGVSQSGLPGIYSWQHLYNWTATPGLHETPAAIPDGVGAIANLNLANLLGDLVINLDGEVTPTAFSPNPFVLGSSCYVPKI